MLDEILLDRSGADFASPAAPLGAVKRQRSAFDVAAVRNRNQHVFFDDQVFDRELAFAFDNLGAARVGEFLFDVFDLVGDQLQQLALIGQDLTKARDVGLDLLVLVLDLAALQRSQAAQRQVEDRLGLDLAQLEAVHQLVAGGLGVLRGANQLDYRVEILERDQQAFQNVQARLGLAQLELGAAGQHAPAMVEEGVQHLAQVHLARPPLVDPEHDQPVALLHLGQLEELIEHHLGFVVALELDHDPHPVAIGFVAQIADAFDAPVVDQLGDPFLQAGLVNLVGDLAHDYRRASAALVGFDRGQRAHHQAAALVQIGLAHRLAAQQLSAGGKIGSRNDVEDLLQGQIGIFDQRQQRVADFAQVVRRDVGRHPDRDTVGAVDQQVGNLAWQHLGLVLRAVEVGNEVDGVLVDIGQHPFRQPRQAAFGVAVGGRRIAVDRAEVALAVDQRIAHAPRLRHPHQRVVHGAVAVRMVAFEHFADHAGALGVAAVGEQSLAEHRDQDSAMDRLEPVAHVGQRAPDIHRHRVVQVGLAHVVFDIEQRGFVADRFVTVGLCHFRRLLRN